jgi:hypothetical protein
MLLLIKDTDKVKKSQAIAIVNDQSTQNISNKTTVFSNINKAKSVYWFDISLKRLNSKGSLNILTYDCVHGNIYHLEVPHQHFTKNLSSFYIRQDKQAISLELDANIENRFQDLRTGKKLHFRDFIKGEYDCSFLTSKISKKEDDDILYGET